MSSSSGSSKAKNRGGRPLERTRDQVEKALRDGGGRISRAARLCGCSYDSICNDLERWPDLQAVRKECHEALIDNAEDKLQALIDDGNVPGILFFLKCQAKHRGYVERVETTGADGGAIKSEVEVTGAVDFTARILGATDDQLEAIIAAKLEGEPQAPAAPKKQKRPQQQATSAVY